MTSRLPVPLLFCLLPALLPAALPWPLVPAPREWIPAGGPPAPWPGSPPAIVIHGSTQADLLAEILRPPLPAPPASSPAAPPSPAEPSLPPLPLHLGLPSADPAFAARCAAAGLLPGAALGPEGYRIQISPTGILAAANAEPGLFYAAQTLAAILRVHPPGAPLPAGEIIDWPAFSFRGVMDDISRGALSNPAFLRAQVRRLAALKVNVFNFYIEDVVRVPSHPGFAPEFALTPAEFASLSAYAARYHIQLMGGFQTLGHYDRILSLAEYAHLGITPSMLDPGRPEALAFVHDVLRDLLPAFSSPWFHLTGDEAFDLPWAAQTRGLGPEGPARLYLDHQVPLIEMVQAHGKRPVLWADMALAHPSILAGLPPTTLLASWDYDPLADFSHLIDPLRATGFDFLVCPGVLNSLRLLPDLSSTLLNLRGFIRQGYDRGAFGVLNCVWDDGGYHLFHRDWMGVAAGADLAWNPAGAAEAGLPSRVAASLAGCHGPAFLAFLETLQELAVLSPTYRMGNASLDETLLPPPGESLPLNLEGWLDVQSITDRAAALLTQAAPGLSPEEAAAWSFTVAQIRLQSCLRLKLAVASSACREAWTHQTNPALAAPALHRAIQALTACRDAQSALLPAFLDLWLRENGYHGLAAALHTDAARLSDLHAVLARLETAALRYSQNGTLPAPADLRLDLEVISGQFFTFWLLPTVTFSPPPAEAPLPDFLTSLGGESAAAPSPGLRFETPGRRDAKFTKVDSDLPDRLDFDAFHSPSAAGYTYAYATLDLDPGASPGPVPALLRHSGPIALLVNGLPVYSTLEVPRSGDVRESSFPLPLQPGRNRLLLKSLLSPTHPDWFSLQLPGREIRGQKQKYVLLPLEGSNQ